MWRYIKLCFIVVHLYIKLNACIKTHIKQDSNPSVTYLKNLIKINFNLSIILGHVHMQVAKLLTFVYAVIMSAVMVGTAVQVAKDFSDDSDESKTLNNSRYFQ